MADNYLVHILKILAMEDNTFYSLFQCDAIAMGKAFSMANWNLPAV